MTIYMYIKELKGYYKVSQKTINDLIAPYKIDYKMLKNKLESSKNVIKLNKGHFVKGRFIFKNVKVDWKNCKQYTYRVVVAEGISCKEINEVITYTESYGVESILQETYMQKPIITNIDEANVFLVRDDMLKARYFYLKEFAKKNIKIVNGIEYKTKNNGEIIR